MKELNSPTVLTSYPLELQEFFKKNLIEHNDDVLLLAKHAQRQQYLFMQLLFRNEKMMQTKEFQNFNQHNLIESSLRSFNLASAMEEHVDRVEHAFKFQNQ